eukprot:CAMPEP_0117826868 /NCGR_PEP_ID=MMETSP0949-20121206/6360_1 /TAXON_ID=44440 /ORGANISM="Chattonella subsalsa, Strain CCMP2191" /LENGTH=359 /DNA_ID=CAMNT_0005667177 /DNA_START=255 /DNA_END=1334 /DNA_ORIENTATION=+
MAISKPSVIKNSFILLMIIAAMAFVQECTGYFQNLEGQIAVVTGASRGIGKGIAIGLAEKGATVYVTGRSLEDATSSVGGTLRQTTVEIEQKGGKCIPIKCDHSKDEDMKRLFEQVKKEQGRLDILVNNAFSVPKGDLFGDFWTQGAEVWDACHTVGLRSHYICSCFAVPIMLENPALPGTNIERQPLIVHVSSFGGLSYTFNVAYGVGKAGVDRLAGDMHVELKKRGINVISLWPGVVKTENTMKMIESGEFEKKMKMKEDLCETPLYSGRAVAALALDPNVSSKSGGVAVVAEIAKEYGFTEEDGTQPPSIRSLQFLYPSFLVKRLPKFITDRIDADSIPDFRLPFWIMKGGNPDFE